MRFFYLIYAFLLVLYLGAANHYGWVVGGTLFSPVERPGSTQHK